MSLKSGSPSMMDVTMNSRLMGMNLADWSRSMGGRAKRMAMPDSNRALGLMMDTIKPMPRHTTIQSMMYSVVVSGSRNIWEAKAHSKRVQARRAGKDSGHASSIALR